LSYSHIGARAVNAWETSYGAENASNFVVASGLSQGIAAPGLEFRSAINEGMVAGLDLIYQSQNGFRPESAVNSGKIIFYSGTENDGERMFSSKRDASPPGFVSYWVAGSMRKATTIPGTGLWNPRYSRPVAERNGRRPLP
jgi:hypothetical protein